MMLFLGIDPGRSGALAVLNKAQMTVETHDMPDTISGLHDLLCCLPPVVAAMVETPFYPKMVGTKHIVVMAENFGALNSALLWRDIPTFECRPSEWKKALNLSPDKDESRAKASQFFPACSSQWTRKKDDGRAEAALIAWFGMGKHK
jgi:hypothetical protein